MTEPTPPHPEPDCQPPSDGGLLPCPFCGSSRVGFGATLDEDFETRVWSVLCEKCGSSCSLYCESEAVAKTQWNTRANPPTGPVAWIEGIAREILTDDFLRLAFKSADKNNSDAIHRAHANDLAQRIAYAVALATPTPEGGEVQKETPLAKGDRG